MTVLEWLLDSDPSIRWQTMRDLVGEAENSVSAERSRVAREGWGQHILDLQEANGQWGGGSYHPYWTSTTYTMLLLRDLGVDPKDPRVREAVARVRDNMDNTLDGEHLFFSGETETCINGMVLALGSYFGEIREEVLERLLDEQLDDGGWNCWAPEESTRASFHTTICVLEGLLEYEASRGPDEAVSGARRRGEEYLLERRMFRSITSGQLINSDWTRFSFPTRWHYDVLRGLDYMRSAGVAPDGRVEEAVGMVAGKRDGSGRWSLEHSHAGEIHFLMDEGVGQPSRWNTLRALRVLNWAGAAD